MREKTGRVNLPAPSTRKVEFGGKEHDLLFNVIALDEVNARFGSVTGLNDKVRDQTTEYESQDLPWLLALLINQNIALRNFEDNTNAAPINPEHIRLRLQPHMTFDLHQAIIKAINLGQQGPPEEGERDIVLEELESKNVIGAEG